MSALVGAARASTVTVQPGGINFDVADGETVIAAAWRNHYYWPTVCGGRGECTACHTVVEEGAEHAVPPGEAEVVMLRTVRATADADRPVRLACQLQVTGPVTLRKKAVRRRITE